MNLGSTFINGGVGSLTLINQCCQLKNFIVISSFPRRHPERSEGSLPQFLGMYTGSDFHVAVAIKRLRDS